MTTIFASGTVDDPSEEELFSNREAARRHALEAYNEVGEPGDDVKYTLDDARWDVHQRHDEYPGYEFLAIDAEGENGYFYVREVPVFDTYEESQESR